MHWLSDAQRSSSRSSGPESGGGGESGEASGGVTTSGVEPSTVESAPESALVPPSADAQSPLTSHTSPAAQSRFASTQRRTHFPTRHDWLAGQSLLISQGPAVAQLAAHATQINAAAPPARTVESKPEERTLISYHFVA